MYTSFIGELILNAYLSLDYAQVNFFEMRS
jgi:hypothetical protein